MNFESFVDAVDESLHNLAGKHYGIFRGPHIAFWQWEDITARLREGAGDDVELMVIDADESARLVLERGGEAAQRVAESIATAWSIRI
jgi:hypothetical protein